MISHPSILAFLSFLVFSLGIQAQSTPSVGKKRPNKSRESYRTRLMLKEIKESKGEIALESRVPYDTAKVKYYNAYFDDNYVVTKHQFSEGVFKAGEVYIGGGPVIKFFKKKADSVVVHEVQKGDSFLGGKRNHDLIVDADVYYSKGSGRYIYKVKDGAVYSVEKTNKKGTVTKYFLELKPTDDDGNILWPRLHQYNKDGTTKAEFIYFSVSKNLNLITWKVDKKPGSSNEEE